MTSADGLRPNDAIVLSIRPEDIELSDAPLREGNEGYNFTEGVVDQKVFLGEYLDFQVKVRERLLLCRVHPSLRVPIGEKIYVRMNPLKCIAIAETTPHLKAA